VSSLRNVKFAGCLYHKGLLSWTQRYCVIADGQLVSYRSEKDVKRPVLSLSLVGRDITYTERMDSSRFSHAMRVSRPGSETHWFYTDTRDVADAWIFVSLLSSGVASMEQMEQLPRPGLTKTTSVIRANPMRCLKGSVRGVGGLLHCYSDCTLVFRCVHTTQIASR